MKETPTVTERIQSLKTGKSFIVKTVLERDEAYEAIRTLRKLNLLNHQIKTTTCPGGFKIFAI